MTIRRRMNLTVLVLLVLCFMSNAISSGQHKKAIARLHRPRQGKCNHFIPSIIIQDHTWARGWSTGCTLPHADSWVEPLLFRFSRWGSWQAPSPLKNQPLLLTLGVALPPEKINILIALGSNPSSYTFFLPIILRVTSNYPSPSLWGLAHV